MLLLTLAVLNVLRSSVVSEEHPKNILAIVVTLSVEKPTLRSVNEEQPSNMKFISMTFDVLRLLRSRLVSDEQPLNVLRNDVTLAVFKLLIPVTDVR
jgi:hypothetical protein